VSKLELQDLAGRSELGPKGSGAASTASKSRTIRQQVANHREVRRGVSKIVKKQSRLSRAE